jgi:DNA polymerase II small subunit
MDTKIIEYATKNNLIISEEALRCLNISNYKYVINKLSENKKIFVNTNDIKEIIKNCDEEEKIKTNEDNFYIIDKYDVTNKKLSQGKVEDFHKLFLHKYEVLSKIIKGRNGTSYITIEEAKKQTRNKEVDVIGMVLDKRTTKNENLMLVVDDPTGKTNLIVSKQDEELYEEGKEVLLDNVVGFKCIVLSENVFIVKDIVFPDIPFVERNNCLKDDKYIAIIGDTHIGSKQFLEKEFNNFIDWLNLIDDKDKNIVNKIKYLVIAGDVVDGIGIYPKQYDELTIPNIFEQYKIFEDYILKIPKHIQIFITPGNHDAIKRSDPQPALTDRLVPRLTKEKNIHLIGSPSWVVFDGFKTLIYHGAALHGIYSQIKSARMDSPDTAIKEVLKRRDIMPSYGDRQIFSPIEKNFLIIEEVPDIFIGADAHHHAYSKYKNTHMINTSTWQSMTSFQESIGHVPTLCKVLLFNLKTENVLIKDFYKQE